MTTTSKEAVKSIWRHRGRKLATGVNVVVSGLLAAAILLLVNYLSYRYYARWDVSARNFYKLSDKTKMLIAGLKNDVQVYAFVQTGNEHYDNIRGLLREYEYAAAKVKAQPRLKITFVDPDRDLPRVRKLRQEYELTDSNIIVFDSGGRRKYVEAKDTVEYSYSVEALRAQRKRTGFKGEQVFSSAIQSVTQVSKPVVYFLAGHHERDVMDFTEQVGYSTIARAIGRDNMEVKVLRLADSQGIPKDCSALIIAGPNRRLSSAETDMISDYLNKSGRVMFLLDPPVATGLDELLLKWGVRVGDAVVVDPTQTLTGKDMSVAEYGEHPLTKNLKKLMTMFYMPRLVEAAEGKVEPQSLGETDRPKVTELVSCSKNGWAETDLEQSPVRFDPKSDRPGPVSIAVAVEKGSMPEIDVEMKPARIVVIGDSYFAANGGITGGVGGNEDFFLSCLNWLVDRQVLMAIGPKPPVEIKLDMTREQVRTAFLVIVAGIPALAALIGIAVWIRRR